VLSSVQRALKINPGQSTKDGLFSLEVVACMGACGLAPVITVAGEFHAAIQPDKTNRILQTYRKRAADDAA
jgi:NADH:ubiquinone oxidoreductase subunit E